MILNNYNNINIKNKKGFVLLFAVVLVSIILAISLGVSNITLKELNFSTSARNTNDAFYAADTGVECALFYLRNTVQSFTGNSQAFGVPTENIVTQCNGVNVALDEDENGDETATGPWFFNVTSLGEYGFACALVEVIKENNTTTIISRGYNLGHIPNENDSPNCDSNSANQVERVIEVRY
jgi:Tfp pilus assembly protein PilX